MDDAPPDFTVVCFDIADARRRRRVVRVLEAFASRAPESVCEGWVDRSERRALQLAVGQAIARLAAALG
ncbi:MAG TPA: hypothetical protein PK440_18400, partial [Candidatus Accumulibacter phosphatis]|nr:hypothetical protein [Candidatus Accumulibacter phosphatis]